MEELETLESTECPECPGPPPEFRLPPPPRPPFLTEGTFCSEAPLAELEDCVAIPMIDASYHTNPSLQSTALIITCAVVLLLMAAIISVVFWKHKRKVQNLLPCKSAAGAAAAGRARVLPDGQPHPTPGTGGPVLYEDLPEALGHSQLHNHHPGHPSQPTIEVRANPEQRARVPAPHHLDYLDYRDPRAILRVADKPSRAVLGGYRTPRALLAKSQGVPLSITTHSPLPNATPLVQNHLLATQNALITSQQSTPCSIPETHSPITPTRIRTNNLPITPTHRPRMRTPTHAPASLPPSSPLPSRLLNQENTRRRPSVDSEGYSYIDFKDTELDHKRNPLKFRNQPPPRLAEKLLSSRSSSLDSEGYSYIDLNYRRAPGTAKRVLTDGTEEEVCPLCTIQQIHHLLARPEDVYLNVQDT